MKIQNKNPVLSVCFLLNIQGLNPGANRKSCWKLPRIRELIQEYNSNNTVIPFAAICETWLKPEVYDAEIQIENNDSFRSDRIRSLHGGVLLYTHKSLAVEDFLAYDDDVCEAVVCKSNLYKIIICCIYRPPTANSTSFANMLNFMTEYFEKHNNLNEMQLVIVGDFNLPLFSWKDNDNFFTTIPNYQSFQNFMERHLLCQYVQEPTRKSNILDFFLTDNPNFSLLIECEDILMSDHKLVKVFTDCFNFVKNTKLNNNLRESPNDSSSLDFSIFNWEKSDFKKINHDLSLINWEFFIENTSINNFPSEFNYALFSILSKHCPLKTFRRNSHGFFQKQRITITRKIRKLTKRLES